MVVLAAPFRTRRRVPGRRRGDDTAGRSIEHGPGQVRTQRQGQQHQRAEHRGGHGRARAERPHLRQLDGQPRLQLRGLERRRNDVDRRSQGGDPSAVGQRVRRRSGDRDRRQGQSLRGLSGLRERRPRHQLRPARAFQGPGRHLVGLRARQHVARQAVARRARRRHRAPVMAGQSRRRQALDRLRRHVVDADLARLHQPRHDHVGREQQEPRAHGLQHARDHGELSPQHRQRRDVRAGQEPVGARPALPLTLLAALASDRGQRHRSHRSDRRGHLGLAPDASRRRKR